MEVFLSGERDRVPGFPAVQAADDAEVPFPQFGRGVPAGVARSDEVAPENGQPHGIEVVPADAGADFSGRGCGVDAFVGAEEESVAVGRGDDGVHVWGCGGCVVSAGGGAPGPRSR